MTAKIIDGRALAEKINDNTVLDITGLDKRPNLAVIFVGDNPESTVYMAGKEKKAKSVGIDIHCYRCEPDLGQERVIEMIDWLNADRQIDGILVELPLPPDMGYDTDAVIARIDPAKDVDRFHPKVIGEITSGFNPDHILPPVYGAVLEMFESINCELSGSRAAVLSKSDIFGGNLTRVLGCRGARAELYRPDEPGLATGTKNADILISALGQAGFVTGDMIKSGAILIDVGVSRKNGSIAGDVDFESCKDKAGFISPVPGGVGPLTVAMTFRNTLELHKRRRNQ